MEATHQPGAGDGEPGGKERKKQDKDPIDLQRPLTELPLEDYAEAFELLLAEPKRAYKAMFVNG